MSDWSSDVCSSDLPGRREWSGRGRLIAAAIIAVGPVIAAIARVRTVPVIAVDHAAGALVTVMLAAMLPVVAAVAGIMLLAVTGPGRRISGGGGRAQRHGAEGQGGKGGFQGELHLRLPWL